MKKRWFHDIDWHEVFRAIYNDPAVVIVVVVITIDFIFRHFIGG
jgi:hypothetical protein